MLLPLIGAGLGGIEAYRRSGGNIGATALGALGGAAVPSGLRMAGTALGALGAGALGKTALGQVLKAQTAKTGTSLLTQIPGAAGGLAAGAGTLFLGAPALAGAIASKVAPGAQRVAGQAGQLGLGAVGTQSPEGQYSGGGPAVPPGVGQYGGTDPFGAPTDILGIPGMGQYLSTIKSAEAQRDAIRTLYPEVQKFSEAAKKAEMERNMAAAGIRQNIATRAAMLQAAQQAGLGMGQTAAQQIGSALTSQYQYS